MIFQGVATISFFKMLYQGKGYSFLEMNSDKLLQEWGVLKLSAFGLMGAYFGVKAIRWTTKFWKE